MTPGVDAIRQFLEGVLEVFGIDAAFVVTPTDQGIDVVINGDDLGALIGRHGMTIDAIEHIAQRAAQNAVGEKTPINVTLDIQDYRKRREFSLQRTAARAASDAVRLREPIELDSMRRFERKVVTEFLQDRPDVYTRTTGEEPHRFVTVYPRGVNFSRQDESFE